MEHTPGTGQLGESESRVEVFRHKAGFVLAPLMFVVLWFLPIPSLSQEAHRLLAVLGLTIAFWVTESIPLPAAALLGPALCVLVGVSPVEDVFRNFAHPIIFLFMGSFLIAEGMMHHGLNRRIAFGILGWGTIGQHPTRLLLAFGGITGFLSMWLSNTATTAMMFPIGLAVLREMALRHSALAGQEMDFRQMPFSTGLMLITAYGASLGGLATPVGTPPNLIGLGQLEKVAGIRITFFQWMSFGLPLAVILILFLGFYFRLAFPTDPALLNVRSDWVREQRAKLGPWKEGEINVLVAFLLTVSFWLLPGILNLVLGKTSELATWFDSHLPEATVALMGALLLFMLPIQWKPFRPTITWKEATRIDWGTIMLFGGGLALGNLMFRTGLAKWVGSGLAETFAANSQLALTLLFAVVASLLSETTSNSASATMVVPVAVAVARAAEVDVLPVALAACLGASMGFMLPVSTPPNAIVYGSGCIPITKMIRYGFLLTVTGFAMVVVIVNWWVPWVLSLN